MPVSLTKEDLTAIEKIVEKSVKPLKEDIAALKTDVSSMKEDIVALKTDVSSMKEDVKLLAALNQLDSIRKDPRLMRNLQQAV